MTDPLAAPADRQNLTLHWNLHLRQPATKVKHCFTPTNGLSWFLRLCRSLNASGSSKRRRPKRRCVEQRSRSGRQTRRQPRLPGSAKGLRQLRAGLLQLTRMALQSLNRAQLQGSRRWPPLPAFALVPAGCADPYKSCDRHFSSVLVSCVSAGWCLLDGAESINDNAF